MPKFSAFAFFRVLWQMWRAESIPPQPTGSRLDWDGQGDSPGKYAAPTVVAELAQTKHPPQIFSWNKSPPDTFWSCETLESATVPLCL